MGAPRRILPPLLANLALTVASLVVLGLVLEAGARLVLPEGGPGNFTPVPMSLVMRPDFPGARFILRPSASVVQPFPSNPDGYFDRGGTLTYRTNALGFRGPETTLEKPPGTFRIVGIGDSYTFGTGVRQKDTFLARLEQQLNEVPGARRFEVLNLGVFAYDTKEEVALLRYRGLRLDPDLVVLAFFLNDTWGGAVQNALNRPADEMRPFWRRHLRLADSIAAGLERRRGVDALIRRYHEAFADRAPGWIVARRRIRQAKRLTAEHGISLVMVVFPVLWQLGDSYPFADIHAEVVAFGERLGIPTLDLQPAFAGHDGPELWVHPSNQHPNAEAHRIAGAALHRFLLERGLVPGAAGAAEATRGAGRPSPWSATRRAPRASSRRSSSS